MQTKIKGKCIVLGKNIDTDQIYPGRFLEFTDPADIGAHCLFGVDESIAPSFPKGGIVVAAANFGCGSSREHAPIALINMGASCVIADSFARIFFRNAINLGLPLIVCRGLSGKVRDGDEIEVDMEKGTVTVNGSAALPCEKLGAHALSILEAGGIKPLMRRRMEELERAGK